MWRFVHVPFIQLWRRSWFFHIWARIFRHSGTGSLSEDPGSWPNNSWPIWCLCNSWLKRLLDLTSMFQLDGWCILGSRFATIFSAPPTDHPAEEVQSGVRGKFHSYQTDLTGAQSSYEMFASSFPYNMQKNSSTIAISPHIYHLPISAPGNWRFLWVSRKIARA